MTTDLEVFHTIKSSAIGVHTEKCMCADNTYSCWRPGECIECEGAGYVEDGERKMVAGPRGIQVVEDPTTKCEECAGTGVCPDCNGRLVRVPNADSPEVMASIFFAWFMAMSQTRQAEDFSRFSVQWDILDAYLQELLAANPPTPEQMRDWLRDTAEKMGDPEDARRTPQGQLSDEELRELGVLGPEDGTAVEG